MTMPVMRIWKVRVLMTYRLVRVHMRMFRGGINAAFMAVLMMLVMSVLMLMHQNFMRMFVRMLFG